MPPRNLTNVSPIFHRNLTNLSSALADEATNPPMRTMRINVSNSFHDCVSILCLLAIESISVPCDCAGPFPGP
jgi:hypothetical protein